MVVIQLAILTIEKQNSLLFSFGEMRYKMVDNVKERFDYSYVTLFRTEQVYLQIL